MFKNPGSGSGSLKAAAQQIGGDLHRRYEEQFVLNLELFLSYERTYEAKFVHFS